MWKRLAVALLMAATCALPPCAPCFAAPVTPAAPATPAAGRAETHRPRIEVAFVLDATGSMGSFIEDARTRIRAVAAELSAGEPRPDVRFALVGFRDKGDAFVTRVTPFTADVSVMHAALTELQADGGGDTPEAVLEAVRDALLRLKWTPVTPRGAAARDSAPVLRLLYLVGDAPPQRYPDSPDEGVLLELALKKGISIQSIVCGEPGASGRAFFERIAERTEGRSVSLAEAAARRAAPGDASGPGGGAVAARSVGGTISGTTRTLAADTLSVDFTAARAPVTVGHLAPPAVSTSGLSGAQLRHVTDAATFSDLWRAHTSLVAGGTAPPPPFIDFAKQQVLVTGGADAGLIVEAVREDERRGLRVATVRAADPGLRFYIVPAAAAPVVAVAARPAGVAEKE